MIDVVERVKLATLLQRIEELEGRLKRQLGIYHNQRESMDEMDDRIEELEEELIFKNRWINQTLETGQMRAERHNEATDDTEWTLTVLPEQE